ncbi:unnamed protein product [Calypogeia fissa]
MTTNASDVQGGPAPASRPLSERLIAVFRFSRWFPKNSSKNRSSRTRTDSSGSQKKARSSSKSTKNQCSRKKAKEDFPPNLQQQVLEQLQRQERQPITSISSNPPVLNRPKIANYEPPRPYTSRRIGSINASATSGRSYSGPISAASSHSYSGASRGQSGSQSVPVSGELCKGGNGGPKILRSSSKSLSKLRDQYVRAMVKLGDMADSVSLGTSVNFESQVFESDVIRKRSQADNEVMDYYLNSSIQPDEWKDAHMGSRIIRNGAISV